MSSFSRSTTPSLPTRQIFTAKQRVSKSMLEFFLFSHVDSDILELVVFNCDSDMEYEHMILSKKAVLAQVDEELVARFELARLNRDSDKESLATEEDLLEDCTNDTIGEFVVGHVSVDPRHPDKLLLAPISNHSDKPMSIMALKPRGHSDLNFDRSSFGSDGKASDSSRDAMKPSSSSAPTPPDAGSPRTSPRPQTRRPSLVLKAVDAFKQAVAHKETHDQRRASMHPAKGRLHRSVKRVMLQNAVEKMRNLLGRPPSTNEEAARSRPGSRASAGGEVPRKLSHLDSAREEIEARKKSSSP